MNARVLAISGVMHTRLVDHLLPADGSEAAAILLCALGHGPTANLIVKDLIEIPFEECAIRKPDFIAWPGERLAAAQDRAEDEGLTLVLIHSHPGGLFDFSSADDESDEHVMRHLFEGWCGPVPTVIGSAIMVPGGIVRARCYSASSKREDMSIRIAGHEIRHYRAETGFAPLPMAFEDGMATELRNRTACVIGVSGTGSIIAEQAARLGFGRLILIDFDLVERKNLNRILNSTISDAQTNRAKVEMFGAAIGRYRDDADVVAIRDTILSRQAVIAASSADVIFSCVDSSEGRQIADLIAQAYLIPLIDMGVTIPTRSTGSQSFAVADVIGRVDYIQPGRSSLGARGVYTPESLRSEYLARVAPDAHRQQLAEGYIKGAPAEAPGVIALNMRTASGAMLEYIARTFPFRHEPNRDYARVQFSFAEMDEEHFCEDDYDVVFSPLIGCGAIEPLLGLPALAAGQ